MPSPSSVVTVIAARNEAPTITTIVDKCIEYGDVIVAEGGSTDKTVHLAARHGAKVLTGLMCLRDAYAAGFRAALALNPDYIIQMDAGFSHDPDNIPALLQGLDTADMVIGSRFVQGGKMIGQPFRRKLLSWAGSWLVRRATGMPYRDLTSGFKAYRAYIMRSLALPGGTLDYLDARMYAFQFELTWKIHAIGYQIVELPITYTGSLSRVNPTFIKEALKIVWRLR